MPLRPGRPGLTDPAPAGHGPTVWRVTSPPATGARGHRTVTTTLSVLVAALLGGCSTVSAPPVPSGSSGPTLAPVTSRRGGPHPTTSRPLGPVVVIDPGHSGRWIQSRTTNGLLDVDYPNEPEMTEVFDIGTCVATSLRADGYRVVMTKQHAGDSVSLTERAHIASHAHAVLAVSIHDDHSQGPGFQATYSQRGVAVNGRYPVMYRGTGRHRTTFEDPAVARDSARAAEVIAASRTAAQGRPVRVAQNSFTGRPPLEPGNLAMVQLLADVPWVYNEAGALTGGSPQTPLGLAARSAYATGLLDGIESAVPITGRTGSPTPAARLHACLAHG